MSAVVDRENGWVWSPREDLLETTGKMEVKYDVVRDTYFTTNTAGRQREGWSSGVWRSQNIQRTVETLWNKVFLSRVKASHPAEIEWVVRVREGEMITRVVLRVESRVYQGASVEWLLGGGDVCLMPSPGTEHDLQLAGATQVLSGPDGDEALSFHKDTDRGTQSHP